MRIALTPAGTRGDVFPLLTLGTWLREAGHEVRVCTAPDFAHDVEAHGFEHVPVGRDVRADLGREAEAITRGGWRVMRATDRIGRDGIGDQFRDLVPALRDCDFVVGAGVQLAAASVCEALGIPYRYVAYCPAIVPSRAHPPFVFERQTRSPRTNRALWSLVRAGLGASLRGLLSRERARLGLGPVRDPLLHMATPRPVLAADPVLSEPPLDAPFELDRIGCLHPFESERHVTLPEKLEIFLAQGPPPVYVGFGSMTDPRPAETTACVLEAVRRAGCRAIVSRGWAELGEGPLPSDVMAIGPVPHGALFPRMAAIVHHGGAGTTTTAARAGVPQIVVPHVLDQFYWAHRVHVLGVGPPAVRRRDLTATRLADAIVAATENEWLGERAHDLAHRMRCATADLPSWETLLRPI